MIYELDGKKYPVIVEKKKNKNTYIRVKEDQRILVTTHYLVTNRQIMDLLKKNENAIRKMIQKRVNEQERNEKFYYLGSIYDIIIVPTLEEMDIVGDKIYVKSEKELERFLDRKRKELFCEHYERYHNRFQESIPMPTLKIRMMKTRWGVCNKKSNTITLNANLIKYPIECLDYVIVHELAHLVYFDHSQNFWNVVAKYFPEYKKYRRLLKD